MNGLSGEGCTRESSNKRPKVRSPLGWIVRLRFAVFRWYRRIAKDAINVGSRGGGLDVLGGCCMSIFAARCRDSRVGAKARSAAGGDRAGLHKCYGLSA
jgi:hypothetical protein